MKSAPCRCRIRTTHADIQHIQDRVSDISSRMEWLKVSYDNVSRHLYDISNQVHRLTPGQGSAAPSLPEHTKRSLAKQLAQDMVKTVEQCEGKHDANGYAPAGEEKRYHRRSQGNRLSALGDPAFAWRPRRSTQAPAALS